MLLFLAGNGSLTLRLSMVFSAFVTIPVAFALFLFTRVILVYHDYVLQNRLSLSTNGNDTSVTTSFVKRAGFRRFFETVKVVTSIRPHWSWFTFMIDCWVRSNRTKSFPVDLRIMLLVQADVEGLAGVKNPRHGHRYDIQQR